MSVRVRAYNVGFGDCFLVSFPDGGATKHMLIDFGNAPGQTNDRFEAIAEDIERETGGHINVLVISHEHLDHIEGFYSTKDIFGDPNRMTIDYVWMSLPSDPDYYTDYPAAEPHKRLVETAVSYGKALAKRSLDLAPSFETMLRNNDLSNLDRLKFIKGLPQKSVKYLRRGNRTQNSAFTDAAVRILAPEKDMSVYYSGSGHNNLSAMANALNPASAGSKDAASVKNMDWWSFPKAPRVPGRRPPNLTDRDWNALRSGIEGGGPDAIRTIDKAQNNSSLVFILEVEGKRLLFPGDAEVESWQVFHDEYPSQMKPVDFLKVSHHGSHNGSLDTVLDKVLPKSNAANATVMVSTKSKVYGTVNPVPDEDTLADLKERCFQFISTEDKPNELFVEVTLP